MYNDILNKVSDCEICIKYENSKSKQEILTHDVSDFKLLISLSSIIKILYTGI